jgi:hypothetical protein
MAVQRPAVRCKQPNGTEKQPLSTNKKAASKNEKQPAPFRPATQQRSQTKRSRQGSVPATSKPSGVSKGDTSKEGTTPMVSSSPVQRWTGFHPETHAAGMLLQHDAPNGKSDVGGRHRHATGLRSWRKLSLGASQSRHTRTTMVHPRHRGDRPSRSTPPLHSHAPLPKLRPSAAPTRSPPKRRPVPYRSTREPAAIAHRHASTCWRHTQPPSAAACASAPLPTRLVLTLARHHAGQRGPAAVVLHRTFTAGSGTTAPASWPHVADH